MIFIIPHSNNNHNLILTLHHPGIGSSCVEITENIFQNNEHASFYV